MGRPELTQHDLEEVDRLLALANSCNTGVFATSPIKESALKRAADILGVLPEKCEQPSTPTGSSSSSGSSPQAGGKKK